MLITKSTKYRNTLKVSHADSFGLKVLGKIEIANNAKRKKFFVHIFECQTLKFVETLIGAPFDNVDDAYQSAKKDLRNDLKNNEFITVSNHKF